ncbi:carboxymuconolactone decarboxylase family protein [Nocardia sp. NPDC051052]|uniref:carboxymuconolactone decarboxylase family protein n=1 Tax=Nocardia sp. NPDC051052 TaxID=3364322 RepID=UPI003795D140
MHEQTTTDDSGLGGRLPLLPPAVLDQEQKAIHDGLRATRVRTAASLGYPAMLPDGQLIGPFNVMLRAPQIAGPLLEWAQALSRSGIPKDVREVVILTVAAHWRAKYMLFAHTAAAERIGLSESVIAALRQGEPSSDLRAEADVARRLTLALVRDRSVPTTLYDEAVSAFGVEMLVALVNLIGQYVNTAALLTCFRVPAPHGAA